MGCKMKLMVVSFFIVSCMGLEEGSAANSLDQDEVHTAQRRSPKTLVKSPKFSPRTILVRTERSPMSERGYIDLNDVFLKMNKEEQQNTLKDLKSNIKDAHEIF